jgi:hypothetical protein
VIDIVDHPLPGEPTPPAPAPACQLLRGAGIRACCLDDATRAQAPAPAVYRTVRDLLDAVTQENPGYRWEVVPSGLVNVYPVPSVLDDPVGPVKAAGTGLWRVLDEILGITRHNLELFVEFRDGDGPLVNVDLPAASLRTALNALVASVPDTVWHISGTPDAYFLTVSAIR